MSKFPLKIRVNDNVITLLLWRQIISLYFSVTFPRNNFYVYRTLDESIRTNFHAWSQRPELSKKIEMWLYHVPCIKYHWLKWDLRCMPRLWLKRQPFCLNWISDQRYQLYTNTYISLINYVKRKTDKTLCKRYFIMSTIDLDSEV